MNKDNETMSLVNLGDEPYIRLSLITEGVDVEGLESDIEYIRSVSRQIDRKDDPLARLVRTAEHLLKLAKMGEK